MFFVDNYVLMAQTEYGDVQKAEPGNQCEGSTDQAVKTEGIAYHITENAPLSRLYGMPVRVVKFSVGMSAEAGIEAPCGASASVDSLSKAKELVSCLAEQMQKEPAYYTVRVPAQFPELLAALSEVGLPIVFCGGTVAYAINPAEAASNIANWKSHRSDIKVFKADSAYLNANCRKLCKIAEESFQDYSGQYHIAPRTAPKAGMIYSNWIRTIFDAPEGHLMMVAECEGEPAGFSLITESEYGMDMELTAVLAEYRGHGIYTELMRENVRYASSRNCIFVSSTQLDNFGSQRTWAKVGMRPYYTIYNLHVDCLESNMIQK